MFMRNSRLTRNTLPLVNVSTPKNGRVEIAKQTAGLPCRKTRRSTDHHAGIAGRSPRLMAMAAVTVVMMMVVVMPVAMGVVAMMEVMPMMEAVVVVPMTRHPDQPAVSGAAAPVMVAAFDPPDVVDHGRIDDSRLHRRRCDDRRAGARRRQHRRGPGDRQCSQCQKELAHSTLPPRGQRDVSPHASHRTLSTPSR